MLEGTQKMIWDLEFKREKTLMIREEVRQEYNGVRSKLSVVENTIKSQLKDPEKKCEVHNPEEGKEPVHKDKGTCTCEYIENAMSKEEIERLYDNKVLMLRDALRLTEQMKQMDQDVSGAEVSMDNPDGVIGINHQIESARELKAMIQEYIKKL